MESGELRVASARIGSSSIWRSSAADVFSGSSRRDDDEEELKWAAIEKLPTYLRLTRGLLNEAEGQAKEIDIYKLGPLERKNLVERLVKIAEEDNEKFLWKLRDRIDRVGLDIPTIEVRFEHLNVEAEAHVGSRALPTNFNFCINMLEVIMICSIDFYVMQTVPDEAEYTYHEHIFALLSEGIIEFPSPSSQQKEAIFSSS